MSEVETLTYFKGRMDFEETATKRQRLEQNQFYDAQAEPEFFQSENFPDSQTSLGHGELVGAWALNDLHAQNNGFDFPNFEATDLTSSLHHDESFNTNDNFFDDDLTYGSETLDQRGHLIPEAVTLDENNEASAPAFEVVEDEAPNTDQLCFGMIADVPITASQSSMMNFDTSRIPVTFHKPNHLYQVERNTLFGELDDRPAKILSNLTTEEGICFQIYCRTINRRAAPGKKGSRKIGANELQYVMNAIIYGPEHLCNEVGLYLAKCGVYLQEPIDCDKTVLYCNPQFLSRTGERVMTDQLGTMNTIAELERITAQDGIFSELSCDDHLSLTDAPDAIGTPLYRHQKKALTFMVRREEGWQYDGSEDDLWVKEVDETGQMTYTNMITETSQKTNPPDSRGGLLADQMGLGKSLTMISLIALNTCKTTEGGTYTAKNYVRRLKSTLIVVPYSLLETWNTQLNRHLKPNTLTWMRFHGTQKKKIRDLGNFDIVITTFETLVRQQKRHENPECQEDTLYSSHWHRIVLDEAHTIRNRATGMARASCAVEATNRWAITGTPIQNRATDFASLLEFLKIYPFSNPKVFDAEIAKPWLKTGDKDPTRMKRLVNCISLCRTNAIIDLPKREDLYQNLNFSASEQECYDKAKEKTIRKLDAALANNPLHTGQYLNALQWLNELRLLCNHGLIHSNREVNKSINITPPDTHVWNKATANKAFETIVCANEAICSVCGNILSAGAGEGPSPEAPKPYLAKCLTLICGSCVKDSPNEGLVPTCSHNPLCKSVEVSWTPDMTTNSAKVKTLPDIPEEQVSTKLRTLMSDLTTCPEGEKSVVFSYWTFTLDLIESLFIKQQISYTRIDGQHSGEKREVAIQKFQTDSTIQVILVSITCGGAGHDLTAASVAYLLEPQWNPMMEEQALCRIHRLGQAKEVRTIRYRIRGSFEDRVVQTQDVKKEIASEAFTMESRRNPLDNRKRLEDLRSQLI